MRPPRRIGVFGIPARRGDWVHLAAPGENIKTSHPNSIGGTYTDGNDTSIAAPHVAGAAALLWANALALSSSSIKARLLAAAETMTSLNNNVNQNKFLNAYNGLVSPKATATVTLTPETLTQTYDGTPKSVTATTDPPGIPYTITYNGSTNIPTNAGTYTVVATINTNPYYQGSDSNTLVIGKAEATISINNIPSPGTAVVGGYFDPTFFVTPSSGTLSVASNTTTTCTVNPSTKQVSYIGTGTCTLVASVTEGTNHLAATGTPQSFTIDFASLNPPTGFHIVTISSSSVMLEWNAGIGLEGYRIYWGNTSGNYGAPLGVGNVTMWTLNGFTSGLTYYFAVTGLYNGTQETEPSVEVSTAMPNPGTLDKTLAPMVL